MNTKKHLKYVKSEIRKLYPGANGIRIIYGFMKHVHFRLGNMVIQGWFTNGMDFIKTSEYMIEEN